MIDKSSLLKSQGSLYLEFIPKDGLFHKMLLLSLMGFLTGWCNHQSRSTPLATVTRPSKSGSGQATMTVTVPQDNKGKVHSNEGAPRNKRQCRWGKPKGD